MYKARESIHGTSTAWLKYVVSIFSLVYLSSVCSFDIYMFLFHFLRLCWRRRPPPLLIPVRTARRSVTRVTFVHVWYRSTSRMFKIPTPFLLHGQSLPSLRPPLPGYVEEMGAPVDVKKFSSTNEGIQGGVSRGGGTRLVRYTQQFHITPRNWFPGRLRIAALEAGFSSFRRK